MPHLRELKQRLSEIMTQTEWTGTTEELLSADGGANATLLPAGYGEYGYLSIADEGTYEAYLSGNSNKAFATSKATAVEQFSWEYDNNYSSGLELIPVNAILNFTINGLDASTGISHSNLTRVPLFTGFFGNLQMRICVDFAPIWHCYYSLVGCKGTKKKSNNAILKC